MEAIGRWHKMLKSMKYEFRKNAFTLAVMGVIFVIAEVMFLIGVGAENGKLFGIGMTVLVLIGFVGSVYILINGVGAYSRDLKDKSGYLVFMTPISTYKVIGAKLLMILVEILVFSAVSFLVGVLDILFLVRRTTDYTLEEIIEGIAEVLPIKADQIYVQIAGIAVFFLTLIIGLYMIVTMAYLAISLSSTVLQNKRGKGLASFLVFLAMSFVISYVQNLIPSLEIAYPNSLKPFQIYLTTVLNQLPQYGFNLLVCVACFIGTVKLLDKQISL